MNATLALGRIVFLEFVRQKIFWLAGILGIFLILFSILIGNLSLDENLRIFIHLGLSAIQLVLIFLFLIITSTFWAKERERKTLHMSLARPLSRSQVFFGHFLGIFILLFFLQLLLGSLHGLLTPGQIYFSRLLWTHIHLFFEVLMLASVSFALGVKLRPFLAGSMSLVIWLGGHWQRDVLFFSGRVPDSGFHVLSEVFRYLLPSLTSSELRSVYFLSEPLIQTWGVLSLFQVILYSLIWLLLGEWLFKRGDLV